MHLQRLTGVAGKCKILDFTFSIPSQLGMFEGQHPKYEAHLDFSIWCAPRDYHVIWIALLSSPGCGRYVSQAIARITHRETHYAVRDVRTERARQTSHGALLRASSAGDSRRAFGAGALLR